MIPYFSPRVKAALLQPGQCLSFSKGYFRFTPQRPKIMSEPSSQPSVPGGSASGFSVIGRKLLTVTATSATSNDSLIESLLKTTFPKVNLQPGETLEAFAGRVADAAGLTVAKWEFSGT